MKALTHLVSKGLVTGVALLGLTLTQGLHGQTPSGVGDGGAEMIMSQLGTQGGTNLRASAVIMKTGALAAEGLHRGATQARPEVKTTQLRRYEIRPELMDDFVSWWKQTLVPVRIQLGFSVEFAFVDPQHSEFIWAVSVPGDRADFLQVQDRYTISAERARALETLPGIEASYVSFVEPVPWAIQTCN